MRGADLELGDVGVDDRIGVGLLVRITMSSSVDIVATTLALQLVPRTRRCQLLHNFPHDQTVSVTSV